MVGGRGLGGWVAKGREWSILLYTDSDGGGPGEAGGRRRADGPAAVGGHPGGALPLCPIHPSMHLSVSPIHLLSIHPSNHLCRPFFLISALCPTVLSPLSVLTSPSRSLIRRRLHLLRTSSLSLPPATVSVSEKARVPSFPSPSPSRPASAFPPSGLFFANSLLELIARGRRRRRRRRSGSGRTTASTA
jgi:hypothetical protein